MAFDTQQSSSKQATITSTRYFTAGEDLVQGLEVGGVGRGDRTLNVGLSGTDARSILETAVGAVTRAADAGASAARDSALSAFTLAEQGEDPSTQRAWGFAAVAVAGLFAVWWVWGQS